MNLGIESKLVVRHAIITRRFRRKAINNKNNKNVSQSGAEKKKKKIRDGAKNKSSERTLEPRAKLQKKE